MVNGQWSMCLATELNAVRETANPDKSGQAGKRERIPELWDSLFRQSFPIAIAMNRQ
jgi:hypothetical protein